MFGRRMRDYGADYAAPKRAQGEKELIHPMTLDEALSVKVRHRRMKKTLGWIARNRPRLLEELMGSIQPGSQRFWALVLVYEAYESRIRKMTGIANAKVQVATRNGLREKRLGQEAA